jgi:uncharacterized membrane protein
MKDIPVWALTLFYWLHMLGTVLWVGGLVTINLLVGPAARNLLTLDSYQTLMGKVQNQLQNLGWFCLLLLTGTGLMQMSANPNYAGFLAITNQWAVAILVKHLTFGVIVLISAYLTWGLNPALRRAALVASKTEDASRKEMAFRALSMLQKRETLLLRLNLGLAVIILAFTALARSS